MGYDNTNSGALFRNEKKETEADKHPHWTGKLDVEGKTYYVSMWENVSLSGKEFRKLRIEQARDVPPAAKPAPPRTPPPARPLESGFDALPEDDDGLPF